MAPENKHDEFPGYRIYQTHRALFRCIEDVLSPFGLTPGQWNALNQLESRGALSQKQLALSLQREQATITRSIDRMEKRGLVVRTADPSDRRSNLITITDDARDLLRVIEPLAENASRDTLKGFTKEELQTLYQLLEKLKNNANEAGDNARRGTSHL